MSPEDTKYHAPVTLADARATRKVRAGRAEPQDFTCCPPLQKRPTSTRTAAETTPRVRLVFLVAIGAAVALGAYAYFTH